MGLSNAQKMVKFFSSKAGFERMMAESKKWKFNCRCGKTSSVWDVGGVRAGAAGKPMVVLKCPHCGKKGMHRLYFEE